MCSLEFFEIIIYLFSGTSPEVDISMDVQMVDINQFANAKREGPRLVFREYPDD